MADERRIRARGVVCAIAAAGLFGASTPFAKLLVGHVDPVLLAGLLYLGSGSGLLAWYGSRSLRTKNSQAEAPLIRADVPWLGGSILFGGVIAPVLLMTGLSSTPGTTASLLLNLEGVLTALLAWFVFRENFDRRIALVMAAIASGGVLLSWEGRPETGLPWGGFAITGACLAWGIDNNLTRKVSAGDPVQIAAIKGLVAGTVNLAIGLGRGAEWPGAGNILACGALGLIGYGISLTFFVLAAIARHGPDRRLLLRRPVRRCRHLDSDAVGNADARVLRGRCAHGSGRLSPFDRTARTRACSRTAATRPPARPRQTPPT